MKRSTDVVLASVLLVLFSPVLVIVAIVIRVTLGRPVLFQQLRPGRNSRPFVLRKFRTMTNVVDTSGALAPDHLRTPQLGRFLRATGIDELPELWNVLRGEMSLVGPRPLLIEYLTRYTPEEQRRHDVRPGITGWAQIHGIRNTVAGADPTEWSRRIDYDLWYVQHRSARVDAHILRVTAAQSAQRILRRRVHDATDLGQI